MSLLPSRSYRALLGAWFLPFLVVGAVGEVAHAQGKKDSPYAKDLQAFLVDLDANYPFFGVKGIAKEWTRFKRSLPKRVAACRDDQGFIELLAEVVKFLRDGHASFVDIRPKLSAPPPESYPGLSLLPAGKGAVVMISPGNLASVLPPGTEIVKINNKPARRVLDAMGQQLWKQGGFFSSPQRARFWAYRLAFSGTRGDKTTLHYRVGRKLKSIKVVNNQEVKGWPHNYHLPEGLTQGGKSVWYGALPSGVGYIYLRRMDASVEGGIQKALAAHSGMKGWIVDLRGNTGGGYDSSLKSLVGRLQKPVAGIIDAGSVSAAETFARDLVRVCGATLFGTTTAGSSSKKKVFELPSGIAKIRYSVESRMGIQGPIEFHGVTPHVEVEADPKHLRAGQNTEIVVAEAWILGGGKK